ncbi:sodium:proton antiporter [Mucilaginibacter conchicola]|uniref:Sodium:proton antiporter n=1 Tax=Mucilaginibacter conchicola TaxID=2303333 RepID=A0A372NZI2_9SPHI|nr:sodium:proton antiporter [Mucilaginibacter conchicola]RFZ94917.1 sodium:proton antiporter [Mucilaginibacter conchicola]
MNIFAIITALCAVSTLFSYINARWIRLPGVIGVMLLAIIAAVLTLVAGKSFPVISGFLHNLAGEIDFSKTLLDVLLGFLLFASALHFDINRLKDGLGAVITISTVGVILSTLIFAGLLFELAPLLGMQIPFIYCLLFGALVSPTDAVAVAALLKNSKMPTRLETIISGESLFNDGIGLVLFVTFLELAETPDKSFHLQEAAILFSKEVFGGLALGIITGWIAYKLMRSITDFQTIVLISLTLVMAISAIGSALHVSVPLAVVAAGLLVGSHPIGVEENSPTNDYLGRIWKLLDDLLNTILFVMIGLQLVGITINNSYLLIGSVAIILLLMARALSIILPVVLLRRTLKLKYNSITILTWGGLRGGISVALALSLPESPYRAVILGGSFIIVVFSVMVQGLTLNKVVNKLLG